MNVLTAFPFTFKLAIPGLSNPFTSLSSTSPTTGHNPHRLPPTPSPAPPQLDFSERPSRSLGRPTRPLPISLAPNAMSSPRRPQHGSFSPSAPSSPVKLSHNSFSHLTPKLHLSPYEEWLLTQSRVASPAQSHSPSPGPVSRKRGWEPSFSSPSGSETTLACSSGYLEKPAKYQELAERMETVEVDRDSRELDSDDLPPAKRRRGLAGSIVSTAWNAALLGTAVGLSVYRLWKGDMPVDESSSHHDDGPRARKRRIVSLAAEAMSIDPQDYPEPPSPPPPYSSTQEWTSIDYPRALQTTPRRDKGKDRAAVAPRSARKAGAKTTHPRREPRHHHTRAAPFPRGGPSRPPANEAFDFSFNSTNSPSSHPNANDANPVDDVDEQMDWIGGKLAQLIEEGKKALGKEVVVISEAQEDEVDDGSGAWVSDEETDGGRRRSGSIRRRGSTASRYNPGSIGRKSVAPSHPTTPQKPAQARTPVFSTFDEADSGSCESPEVREMMERARAKFAERAMAR